jgi:hypothetical protein
MRRALPNLAFERTRRFSLSAFLLGGRQRGAPLNLIVRALGRKNERLSRKWSAKTVPATKT